MTNQEYDNWFDDLVDGKPKKAEDWQVNYIDSILNYTGISQQERDNISKNLLDMSEQEAEDTLAYLMENRVFLDPQDQFKQMIKQGMFN